MTTIFNPIEPSEISPDEIIFHKKTGEILKKLDKVTSSLTEKKKCFYR